LNVLAVLAATAAGRPGEAKAAAVPVAAGVPVQAAVVYSRTFEPASAVPWTTGDVLGFGEVGVTVVSVTGPGAVESLVYETELIEQPDVFPAASVAVALKTVVLPAATVTVKPVDPKAVAVPVAAGEPVQSEVVYSFTVDPASAVPFTAGVVLGFGDVGVTLRAVTNTGAVESLVYETELDEQAEVFPTASVAVALNAVVLPGATVTENPADPNADAAPVAAGDPVQPEVVYSETVDPASAVPFTTGVVLGFGDAGVTLRAVTNPGGVESLVYETKVDEQAEAVCPLLVAFAKIVVVAFAGTVAVIPAPAKLAADPVPRAALEQVLLE
jgi:hypothetical protein